MPGSTTTSVGETAPALHLPAPLRYPSARRPQGLGLRIPEQAPRLLAWLIFALSVSVYAYVSMAVQHQSFHVGARDLRFFDLRIYRGAAQRVLDGVSIYRRAIIDRLGFTYPPFAALVFTPLAWMSLATARVMVTLANVGALLFMMRRAFAIRRPHAQGRRLLGSSAADAWALAGLAAAAALWLEPITVALGYGQVDLLIAALVVFDITRPDGARGKGIAIGLAAAIKLTPLVFLVYLLLSGRRRAALSGALTFAGAIAVSFMLVPGDATRYWGTLVFRSSRVGNAVDAGNQSMSGAVGRLLHEPHLGLLPLAGVVAVALLGLSLAVRASRRGDEAVGFGLCAVTTLLASPVSWTHHWTLAVPALMLLAVGAYERRRLWMLACAAGILLLGYSYLPELMMLTPHPGLAKVLHLDLTRLHPRWLPMLARDAYVLVGLATILVAAQRAGWQTLRGRAGALTRS